jgi:hypothetical protein
MTHGINADGAKGRIGFDIGRVIVGGDGEGREDTIFSDRYLETPPIEGAIEAIARLVTERFGPHAHLVSKCGANVQARTRQWLDHHRFYERTGIAEGCVHFCRKRHEKGPICTRLGITHFVDDRVEVLAHIDRSVRKYAFRPAPRELERSRDACGPFRTANDWDDILADLLW